jgi:hypothetical protein
MTVENTQSVWEWLRFNTPLVLRLLWFNTVRHLPGDDSCLKHRSVVQHTIRRGDDSGLYLSIWG